MNSHFAPPLAEMIDDGHELFRSDEPDDNVVLAEQLADKAMRFAERLFTCIHAAILMDMEALIGRPINGRLGVEAVIDAVEKARRAAEHYDMTPFPRPAAERILNCRESDVDRELVASLRFDPFLLDAYSEGTWLTKLMASHDAWWRVCREVNAAIAAWARTIDPSIKDRSCNEQIGRLVERFIEERGLPPFQPDTAAIAVELLMSA